MLKFGLLMETESIQFEQECAIKALGILVHDLEREIAAIKKAGFMPVDYLQDISDALYRRVRNRGCPQPQVERSGR